MFIFHHKSTILDINRYDCLAFVNPEGSGKNVFIEKIYVDTTYPINISLMSASSSFDGYRENDLSNQIKSNIINKKVTSVVKIYGHPQAKEDLEEVKEVLVDEPWNAIDKEDFCMLRPGNALIFRAKPKAINTEVHFSVNFLEK